MDNNIADITRNHVHPVGQYWPKINYQEDCGKVAEGVVNEFQLFNC